MRVLVIGAGHNGLTAAFYLARAGLKPIVLEAYDTVGGGALTRDIHPGFQCPALAHDVSLREDVVADMALRQRGVEFLASPVDAFAPTSDGRPVVIYPDAGHTATALRTISAADAQAYASYRASIAEVSQVLASILAAPAPDIDEPGFRDVWNLLRTGRRFRALGPRRAYALLRWAPMPVADFAAEWFESDPLRALVAAPGLSGTMLGPRSAGSTLVLLLRAATRAQANGASTVRGGPGALTRAMAEAAQAAGATIETGVRVQRILVDDGRVAGVVAGGREIRADAIVSAIDPKTTLLHLVDAADLSPDLVSKMRAYRAHGTIAKVNLALSALPAFQGAGGSGRAGDATSAELLTGRIHIGPDLDYLERAFDCAKYGALSDEPWLDVRIPSTLDSTLAPAGSHVMSIYAHYAPFQLRDAAWTATRDVLLERVMATLQRFAPGVERLVVAAEVVTPLELQERHGFHGGHVFHGELALDQLVTMRPLLGFSRYRSPLTGLFLCGAGTHPGGFMSGGSGKLAAAEVLKSAES